MKGYILTLSELNPNSKNREVLVYGVVAENDKQAVLISAKRLHLAFRSFQQKSELRYEYEND